MSENGPIKGVFLGPADAPYDYHGGKLTHNLVLFGRVCRALGMNVTPNRMMDVGRSLAHIQLGRKRDFYYALRTHLVSHPKEFAYFDEAFDIFWKRPSEGFTTLNLQSLGEERLKKKTQFLPPLGIKPERKRRQCRRAGFEHDRASADLQPAGAPAPQGLRRDDGCGVGDGQARDRQDARFAGHAPDASFCK